MVPGVSSRKSKPHGLNHGFPAARNRRTPRIFLEHPGGTELSFICQASLRDPLSLIIHEENSPRRLSSRYFTRPDRCLFSDFPRSRGKQPLINILLKCLISISEQIRARWNYSISVPREKNRREIPRKMCPPQFSASSWQVIPWLDRLLDLISESLGHQP